MKYRPSVSTIRNENQLADNYQDRDAYYISGKETGATNNHPTTVNIKCVSTFVSSQLGVA